MKSSGNKTPYSVFVTKYVFCIVFLFSALHSQAQKDSAYKNTVRFNITNPMIFGNHSLIFGYERVLRNNQTFSINIGVASFPLLTYNGSDTILFLHQSDYEDHGFNFSGDYRFYLKRENKYPAPRGVYIGPYYSYNYFRRTNNWSLNSDTYQGSVQTDLTFNIHTVGVQLGYQFIFWNRLSVDFVIMGPGIGHYGLSARLSSDLNVDDKQAFFEALDSYLSEKIPGYNQYIDMGEFKTTGSFKTTSLGFRYMVLVGFRF
jgi:hypothetical protein